MECKTYNQEKKETEPAIKKKEYDSIKVEYVINKENNAFLKEEIISFYIDDTLETKIEEIENKIKINGDDILLNIKKEYNKEDYLNKEEENKKKEKKEEEEKKDFFNRIKEEYNNIVKKDYGHIKELRIYFYKHDVKVRTTYIKRVSNDYQLKEGEYFLRDYVKQKGNPFLKEKINNYSLNLQLVNFLDDEKKNDNLKEDKRKNINDFQKEVDYEKKVKKKEPDESNKKKDWVEKKDYKINSDISNNLNNNLEKKEEYYKKDKKEEIKNNNIKEEYKKNYSLKDNVKLNYKLEKRIKNDSFLKRAFDYFFNRTKLYQNHPVKEGEQQRKKIYSSLEERINEKVELEKLEEKNKVVLRTEEEKEPIYIYKCNDLDDAIEFLRMDYYKNAKIERRPISKTNNRGIILLEKVITNLDDFKKNIKINSREYLLPKNNKEYKKFKRWEEKVKDYIVNRILGEPATFKESEELKREIKKIRSRFNNKIRSIKITRKALEEAFFAAKKSFERKKVELYMIGTGKDDDLIEKIYIPANQKNTTVMCSVPINEKENIRKEIRKDGLKINSWLHSHCNFDVFHSDIDKNNLRTIEKNNYYFDFKGLGLKIKYLPSIVVNTKEEIFKEIVIEKAESIPTKESFIFIKPKLEIINNNEKMDEEDKKRIIRMIQSALANT